MLAFGGWWTCDVPSFCELAASTSTTSLNPIDNATVSRAWVDLVAHHVAEAANIADFDEFVTRYPALLDKRLLVKHYRSITLASSAARHAWVEPDLTPFPWI
ncbi:MAG: hypothetical protein J2O49_00095 [Sciscionella sp.]|nr:hypothetical protein [Sciscionella sp.]